MKEIKRIIDNHIYILKLIRKGSGWFPLFLIFFSVLRGFNTFFMTTWIYQYVINALQKGEKLTKIAMTAGVVFVFTLTYNALLQFKNAMMEIRILQDRKRAANDFAEKGAFGRSGVL